MNCREFEADVVDLARGAGMSAAAAERAGAHLAQCTGCASRFARERQLTTALKAVAADVPASTRSAAIEEQLLAAFTAHQAASSGPARASRPVFSTPVAQAWLAAAAVIVLTVAGWQGVARWQAIDQIGSRTASTPAPAVVVPPDATQPTSRSVVELTPARVPAPAAVIAAPAAPPVAPASWATTPPAARTREDDVLRFVSLPTAIGLPALESGRIVRVEVPTAMLAAYGLEIPPDSAAGLVEADVLVGQDGQPRAIRFVTLDAEPRRRQ